MHIGITNNLYVHSFPYFKGGTTATLQITLYVCLSSYMFDDYIIIVRDFYLRV